jgi:hypothetical protein
MHMHVVCGLGIAAGAAAVSFVASMVGVAQVG